MHETLHNIFYFQKLSTKLRFIFFVKEDSFKIDFHHLILSGLTTKNSN